MIDCDVCEKSIGNLESPIFVDKNENVVCRECKIKSDGSCDDMEAEFDGDDVTDNELDEYYKKLNR